MTKKYIIPIFNYGEFATIRNQSGLNSFKINVKEFASRTNAISLQAQAGRYGGTYAHKYDTILLVNHSGL